MSDLPSLEMYLITIKYSSNEEGVIVDTRGFNLLEAYTLLVLASEAVRDRIEDAFLIADDEDADLIAQVEGEDEEEDED